MHEERRDTMGTALENVKTDPTVLEALKNARGVQPASAEAYEQMVSFVQGSVKSNVTREKVKQILLEQGVVARP
jgi:DNA-binding TFAR19-related protein (PDSD5 family)